MSRRLGNPIDAIAEGLHSPGLQTKLAGLEAERERLLRREEDAQAMAFARQLIAQVVIHPDPPRKPPGYAAEGIARAAQLSDKEEPTAYWPLVGWVREGQRPSRTPPLSQPA